MHHLILLQITELNRETEFIQHQLIELASQLESGLSETMLALLERAAEQGLIEDAAVAASLDQRKYFWKLRELLAEAPKFEGGSIKHDVCVPVSKVAEFLDEAFVVCEKVIPGSRLVPFGHLGDGNMHTNLSQPVGADKQAFLDRWVEVNAAVHAIVAKHQGSISAEHGIGLDKRASLERHAQLVAALRHAKAVAACVLPTLKGWNQEDGETALDIIFDAEMVL